MIVRLVHAKPRPMSKKAHAIRVDNFLKKRFAQIAQTTEEQANNPHEPDEFRAGYHLAPLPTGYASFRDSKPWRLFELNLRRAKSSICDDCHRFTRCDIHHINITRINDLNPADVIHTCPTCTVKRRHLKPPILTLKPEFNKRNVRKELLSSSQTTEKKADKILGIDNEMS